MADHNPTFSESWYRVGDLRPRLRATVQTHRQHFRGQVWHVVQDPSNNSFFRLHSAAYRFVGMLDGRRSVSQVWRACIENLGDEALTQSEAVEVLGQLYAANLLQADLPPDVQGLFQRYRRRRGRQVRGQLANFLFLRVPLLDPDRMLDALVGVAGKAFSPVGLVLWLALLAVGGWLAAAHWRELTRRTAGLLDATHLLGILLPMYGAFVLAKVLHEFGHALACKEFGRRLRGGGEVHVMGVMFLVFAPIPYVDASSAWALRSKLHRAIIGAAGMMTELALAAVGAIVWVWTVEAVGPWQQALHAAAFHLVFIASVATLLFNANFLLRFDGYYILSDLLEIPNLSERAGLYLRYLVKRFAWGVRQAVDPAHSPGEAAWLAAYGVAATAFRIFICVRIGLMLIERFFFVGVVLSAAAAVAWVLVPAGRFVHYLLAGAELARTRLRAVATTLLALAAAGAALGGADAPDCWYVEGVVEPARVAFVHAESDGFVREVMPSGRRVRPDDPNGEAATPLLRAESRELEVQWRDLLDERRIVGARRRIARLEGARDARQLALVQVLGRNLAALDRQVQLLRKDIDALSVHAPFAGTWVCRRAERLAGAYVRRGEQIGLVADLDNLAIRATAPQRLAGMLNAEADREVEIRLAGRPEAVLTGTWQIRPVADRSPPARPAPGPQPPRRAAQPTPEAQGASFEIRILPDKPAAIELMAGQRAVLRFRMQSKPLLMQWLRSLRHMVQQRLRL